MRDPWETLQHRGEPPRTRVGIVGNAVLRKVLLRGGPVDRYTLDNLIALRAVLAEEFLKAHDGEDRPTQEYLDDVERQLAELHANHSEEHRARESAEARKRLYGRYPGFVD